MSIQFYMPDMQEGEEIKIFLRKHIMFLAGPLVTITVMIILPMVGIIVLMIISPFFTQGIVKNFLILIMSTYMLIMLAAGLFIWFRYYYSYLIVTNLRLIEIEQKSLFDRNTSELELIRIEDVKGLVRGILATFLRYGDVLVETAGATESNFLFEKIPNASYVGTQILELSQKALGTREPELGGRMASVMNQPKTNYPEEQTQNTNIQNKNKPSMPKEKIITTDEPVKNLADQPAAVKKDEIYSNLNQAGEEMSEQMEGQNVSEKPEPQKEVNNNIKGGVLFERDKKDSYKPSGSDKINKG